MVLELKLRKVGNSVGLVLPKEALAVLNAGEGDSVTVSSADDGTLRLSTVKDAEFARQMTIARDLMKRYRNTLRELAK
jgi:putative addiction module antidote